MKTFITKALPVAVFALLLSACTPKLSYEAVEWRIIALAGQKATVEVCYKGVCSGRTNEVVRMEVAERLQNFIADQNPSDAYTPGLFDAKRKAYIEDGKLNIVESGLMENPLSWSQQSGLNPLAWFTPSLGLSVRNNHIVKRGIAPNTIIIASNGQVIDSSTYNTRYVVMQNVALGTAGSNTTDDYDQIDLIVWPSQAKNFYWKFSGPGYNKHWRSLSSELQALKAQPENSSSEKDDIIK